MTIYLETQNKNVTKQLAALERKVLRRMLGKLKYMKIGESDMIMELMPHLSGGLDILSFVRISWLNWIAHSNGMGNKRKVSHVFNNKPQGS